MPGSKQPVHLSSYYAHWIRVSAAIEANCPSRGAAGDLVEAGAQGLGGWLSNGVVVGAVGDVGWRDWSARSSVRH